MAQNGKNPTPTSTPFSTSDGRPDPGGDKTTGANDFIENPTGNANKAPPKLPIQSRPQTPGGDAPGDGVESFRPERAQQPTSYQQRTNPNDRAADGSPFPKAQAPSNRAGTGSLGNSHRPFKLKGG